MVDSPNASTTKDTKAHEGKASGVIFYRAGIECRRYEEARLVFSALWFLTAAISAAAQAGSGRAADDVSQITLRSRAQAALSVVQGKSQEWQASNSR